jgi:hypothetical protein
MHKKPVHYSAPFHDKCSEETRNRCMFLRVIKAIYYTKWRMTETIPIEVRNATVMPTFPGSYSI